MSTTEPIDIVLVGDVVENGISRPTVFDWDNPTWPEVEQLAEWLSRSGRRAEIVPSVSKFITAAANYHDKIVFPLWRGGPSRNRTVVVPAVCEAYGLPYVGGDAFAHGICQDKSLSKHFLRTAGINCPIDIVIRSLPLDPALLLALDNFKFPVVVKPLLSACSIGVDETSLCANVEAVVDRARQLLVDGLGPAICEPFVAGEEVSLCLTEIAGQINLRCVATHRDEAGNCPFKDRLFTLEDKIAVERSWAIGCDESVVFESVWEKVKILISLLGPFDLLRVDGRFADGVFTAIELTPDIHLSLESTFLGGFSAAGVAPATVLEAVIAASLQNHTSTGLQQPNGDKPD